MVIQMLSLKCLIIVLSSAYLMEQGHCIEADSQSRFGYKNYTEYIAGSVGSRLIISIPHGGHLLPDAIPDRQNGCYDSTEEACVWRHQCGEESAKLCKASIYKDMYTAEIGLQLQSNIHDLTGERPFVVFNRLHRRKMDANREIDLAAFGVEDAEQAWHDYHEFLKDARQLVDTRGPGLMVDIHGQIHAAGWVELGYLLQREDLDAGNIDVTAASIRALAQRVAETVDAHELIRGETSIGGMLQSRGYKSVPSPEHQGPDGEGYYRGGYITEQYGSKDAGRVDCIQIESPRDLRNDQNGPRYVDQLAEVISQFMVLYYKDGDDTDDEVGGKTNIDNDGNDQYGKSIVEPSSNFSSGVKRIQMYTVVMVAITVCILFMY